MTTKRKFNFEPFDERARRTGSVPRATIATSGNINLNSRFQQEYASQVKGRHVIFHYDAANKVIGLQVVAAPAPNSYPIRELERGKGMVVTARAFLKNFDIPYDKSSSYDIKLHDIRDSLPFFYIDLQTENI